MYSEVPGENLSVYYDVWSEYPYRYVGRHAGFGRWELGFGAIHAPGAGRTDLGDLMTVSARMDMCDKFGSSTTAGQFLAEVLANVGAMAGRGSTR